MAQDYLPYLYYQFAHGTDPGDEDIKAIFRAVRTQCQGVIDDFKGMNLPLYSDKKGALLDFIALNLYGFMRPTAYGNPVSDAVFHKTLEWHLYRGDGYLFTVPWLKRRIARFLGVNVQTISVAFNDKTVQGVGALNTTNYNTMTYNGNIEQSTTQISTVQRKTTITVPASSTLAGTFKQLVEHKNLELPETVNFIIVVA